MCLEYIQERSLHVLSSIKQDKYNPLNKHWLTVQTYHVSLFVTSLEDTCLQSLTAEGGEGGRGAKYQRHLGSVAP